MKQKTNIKRLCSIKGITQRELAKKMGVTEPHMSLIVNGYQNLTYELKSKISIALNCSIDDISANTDMGDNIINSKTLNIDILKHEFDNSQLQITGNTSVTYEMIKSNKQNNQSNLIICTLPQTLIHTFGIQTNTNEQLIAIQAQSAVISPIIEKEDWLIVDTFDLQILIDVEKIMILRLSQDKDINNSGEYIMRLIKGNIDGTVRMRVKDASQESDMKISREDFNQHYRSQIIGTVVQKMGHIKTY